MNFEFYDIFPRVLKVGVTACVHVHSRFSSLPFVDDLRDGGVKLQWFSGDGLLPDGEAPTTWLPANDLAYEAVANLRGGLTFEFTPPTEGEYWFRLSRPQINVPEDIFCEFCVFALEPDWFGLRPWRGDFHVHSNSSQCAFPNEAPEYVTALGRKRSLDFMSLTDHMQQEPSLEAAAFWRSCNTEFKIFPGEEVHPLCSPVATRYRKNNFYGAIHIVSIGASEGVVKWQNEHYEQYHTEVQNRAGTLDKKYPELVRFLMAASDWIFDKIHEFGGLAIFCHPFWIPNNRYNLPAPVRDYILEQNRFDALEVFGLGAVEPHSAAREGNQLCLAWWQRATIERGALLPVVGNTDSHNAAALLGRQYTIVLAPECSVASICAGVRAGRSVAVMGYPGESHHFCGDLRLVKYAQFLLREFYPEHDALCETEGERMLESLRGGCAKSTCGNPACVSALMTHLWA